MKRPLFFIVILLVVSKIAFAALSFPALSGRVVDEAGILSEPARAQLDQTLATYEQATSNQIVVVTLKSLQGDSIEDYGYQLGRSWGIGQKGKDNGALLIIAPHERKVRIEVGYGLEATLTDAKSNEIIQAVILPDFRSGNMERGVTDGTAAMLATLKGDVTPIIPSQAQPNQHYSSKNNPPAFFIFLVLFILYIFLSILRGSRRGVGGFFIGGLGGGSSSGFSGGFSGGGGSFGGGGASGGW